MLEGVVGDRTLQQTQIRSAGERLFSSNGWYGGLGSYGTYAFSNPMLAMNEARSLGLFTEHVVAGFVGYYSAMQAAVTMQWMQYGFYGKELRVKADLINHTIAFIMYQATKNIELTIQIAKKVVYHIANTKPESFLGRGVASFLTSRSIIVNILGRESGLRRLLLAGPQADIPTVRGWLFQALVAVSTFTMAAYGSAVLLVNDGIRGFEHLLAGALTGERLNVPLDSILIPEDDQAVMDILVVGDELAGLLRELYNWASDFPFLDR